VALIPDNIGVCDGEHTQVLERFKVSRLHNINLTLLDEDLVHPIAEQLPGARFTNFKELFLT
jgi:hypothetical protein